MITAILLVTSIVIAVVVYSLCVVSGKCSRIEEVQHECKYNDIPKCYEKCCNYCNIKSECECCCGGECKRCGGYSIKKKVEM